MLVFPQFSCHMMDSPWLPTLRLGKWGFPGDTRGAACGCWSGPRWPPHWKQNMVTRLSEFVWCVFHFMLEVFAPLIVKASNLSVPIRAHRSGDISMINEYLALIGQYCSRDLNSGFWSIFTCMSSFLCWGSWGWPKAPQPQPQRSDSCNWKPVLKIVKYINSVTDIDNDAMKTCLQ